MIDRDDLLNVCGCDVLEVGVRQELPFIIVGGTGPDQIKRTLMLDDGFSVSDGAGASFEGSSTMGLEPLTGKTVTEVRLTEQGTGIQFDYGAELSAFGVRLLNP